MKKHIIALASCTLALVSCQAWLTEDGPMVNRVSDYFTSVETVQQVVTAVYTPLMWEYQDGYFPEWYFGDIASDDALKGGQNVADGPDLYDIDNFKVVSNNGIILQFYRAQYQGVARANLAIDQVSAIEVDDTFTEAVKTRFLAEAKFLRAYYYFRLVRLFGGVPLVTAPVYGSENWIQPRASVPAIYDLIFSDLKDAEAGLPLKSAYAPEDLGRATKGAAQAMLLKVSLYYACWNANQGNSAEAASYYGQAENWGKRFLSDQAGEYSLCPSYADNFTLEGENGPESVFEIQYMEDGMSDYGEGNGFSRGTFTVILTRSRGNAYGEKGWGFNHPTQSLYDEFEAGDPRRDITILTPTDAEIGNEAEEVYLGSRYLSLKRALMDPVTRTYYHLDHASRGAINNQQIRLADVYLMIAEAALETGDTATAKTYLEKVRARARGEAAILPAFPYGSYSDNAADLRKALRHERRVELAMEGHRWFDLCRWGIAKEVLDAYKAGESEEARSHMGTFTAGKHELMPIPQKEVDLGALEQNPNY
ncbi:MAG: RagB/SusD family nutrient uptake outer membrane protein [Bacteroidales bacterium]|nr:RagB/SusD family nutrient uptake outer membrane protein [Bacteroidales bacterium]